MQRVVRGTRDHPAQPTVVILRLKLEICMAERIYNQVSDVPRSDSENIQANPMIDDCQRAEESNVENEFLRKRKRNRRQPAVQMAFVMLPMNPMELTQVKSAMRSVVPDLGPNCRRGKGEDERHPACPLEKTKIQQGRQ